MNNDQIIAGIDQCLAQYREIFQKITRETQAELVADFAAIIDHQEILARCTDSMKRKLADVLLSGAARMAAGHGLHGLCEQIGAGVLATWLAEMETS